jgi:hypothetical protein
MRTPVVVLSSDTHLAFVKSLVEEDCLIVSTEAALSALDPSTVGQCSLCLVDGRVASDSARFLQTCGVHDSDHRHQGFASCHPGLEP